MKNPEDFTMENMKADIAKAGNLFYQYRACRRDASIIYDIENIRHGVVYARTPLQMNDPFDSKVGFSVGEIYEECIDFALDQVDTTLDSDLMKNNFYSNLKKCVKSTPKNLKKCVFKFLNVFWGQN